jgi:hypothetical protein
MLRPIHHTGAYPVSYPVDNTSTFQPGQIAQLKVIGNDIVCGVSDGTAPIGIIDDINTAAFTANSIDEVVDVQVVGVADGYGNYLSAVDTEKRLDFANIVRSSFVSTVPGIVLYEVNGVIGVPAGTKLNYDLDGDSIPDTVRVIVSYVYRIPNVPGENSTISTSRISFWYGRGIYETDQYDTTATYVVNATLFVNAEGKLTTKQPSPTHPGIALVTGPNSGAISTIEFLWL